VFANEIQYEKYIAEIKSTHQKSFFFVEMKQNWKVWKTQKIRYQSTEEISSISKYPEVTEKVLHCYISTSSTTMPSLLNHPAVGKTTLLHQKLLNPSLYQNRN